MGVIRVLNPYKGSNLKGFRVSLGLFHPMYNDALGDHLVELTAVRREVKETG